MKQWSVVKVKYTTYLGRSENKLQISEKKTGWIMFDDSRDNVKKLLQ